MHAAPPKIITPKITTTIKPRIAHLLPSRLP
jgi:hypothetical protein